MLQCFSDAQHREVADRLGLLLRLPDAPVLRIHNWQGEHGIDWRTRLFNLALGVVRGRYLAFLDYDDVLFPEAYELLVRQMRYSGAGIVFASVQEMRVNIRGSLYQVAGTQKPNYHGESLFDLFRSNFCPIHSYMIDRRGVPGEIMHFDESLSIEEDYDLLLRICAACRSDFSLLDTKVGYYFFKTDGSNTVAQQTGLTGTRLLQFEMAQLRIKERKLTTIIAPEVCADLGLTADRPVVIKDLAQ